MEYKKEKRGYVYILSNPGYPDNLLKIGMTTRTPQKRAWELYEDATGVPQRFVVSYERKVANCDAAEDITHLRLQNLRVNSYREFFKISLAEAKKIVDEVCEEVESLYTPEKILTEADNKEELEPEKSIVIVCSECNQELRIPAEKSLSVKCPSCNNRFDYPFNDYVFGAESYESEEEEGWNMDEDELEDGMPNSGGTTTAEDDCKVTIDEDKNYYNDQLEEKEPDKIFSGKNKELKHKKKKPPGNVKKIVEALLFAVQDPISVRKMSEIIEGTEAKEIREVIQQLREEYAHNRVFQIEEVGNGFQCLSRPEYHEWISKIRRKSGESKLPQQALETLSIIAYKQPIIRAEIEENRGVQSGEMIRTLVEKGLVKITGRDEMLGRPLLYGTTTKFLDHFGLKSIKDLPKVEDLEMP